MSYRFAIIGCGHIASRHAEHIMACGKLAGVCDTDKTKATEFAFRYGTNAYFSQIDLLFNEHPDIVVVCTPNGLHPLHAITALEAGCHVLCEKPLSIRFTSGLEMIRSAERWGKKLFVVKQNRFNPPVILLRKLMDEGKLGKILSFQLNGFWNRPDDYYRTDWRGTKNLDGGLLYTQFSHFIDLLYWFLGDIATVSGYRGNYLHQKSIDFEDSGVAVLLMKSGVTGTLNYTINSNGSNMEGSFTLFGEKGTVKIGGQYLNRIDHFSVSNEVWPPEEGANPSDQYKNNQGTVSNHLLVYKDILQSLNDPLHRSMEASEALHTVKMIEQIYAASPLLQIPAYE